MNEDSNFLSFLQERAKNPTQSLNDIDKATT